MPKLLRMIEKNVLTCRCSNQLARLLRGPAGVTMRSTSDCSSTDVIWKVPATSTIHSAWPGRVTRPMPASSPISSSANSPLDASRRARASAAFLWQSAVHSGRPSPAGTLPGNRRDRKCAGI